MLRKQKASTTPSPRFIKMLTRKQKRPSPKSLVQMLRSTLGFPPTIIMMAQNHSGAIMN